MLNSRQGIYLLLIIAFLTALPSTAYADHITGYSDDWYGKEFYYDGQAGVCDTWTYGVGGIIFGISSANVGNCALMKSFVSTDLDGKEITIVGSQTTSEEDVYDLDLKALTFGSVAGCTGQAEGIFWKPDGLELFVIDDGSNRVCEFDLTVPWNLDTMTFDDNFIISGEQLLATGLFFKPDGTQMYVVGKTLDEVNTYDLSIAWNITSASPLSVISLTGDSDAPEGIFLNTDGTKMFIGDNTSTGVDEYDLGTAYDPTSAVFSQNLDTTLQDPTVNDIWFNSDGTVLLTIAETPDSIWKYTLSTGFDLSTVTYDSKTFDVSTEETQPHGLWVSENTNKLFISGLSGNGIDEYSIDGTEGWIEIWDGGYSVTNSTQFPSGVDPLVLGAGILYSDRDETLVFTPDLSSGIETNSTMFAMRLQDFDTSSATQMITESIAVEDLGGWKFDEDADDSDITRGVIGIYDTNSAVYDSVFLTGIGNLWGGSLAQNGFKMYTVHASGDVIREYDLSVAYDTETATFVQALSVTSQETHPFDVEFNDDGTEMYVVGYSGNDVEHWDLSVAYDLSSAVYDSMVFDPDSQAGLTGNILSDMEWGDSGTKMYLHYADSKNSTQWSLSTAYDPSTAILDDFQVIPSLGSAYGIAWKPDGTVFFVADITSVSIREYPASTPWDITSIVDGNTRSVSAQMTQPRDVWFDADGTLMSIPTSTNQGIYKYTTVTNKEYATIPAIELVIAEEGGGGGSAGTAPTSVSCGSSSPDTATLTWEYLGSDTVSGYFIEFETPIGSGFSTKIADTASTETTYIANQLIADTEYNFRVSTISDVGTSDPSSEFSCRTQSSGGGGSGGGGDPVVIVDPCTGAGCQGGDDPIYEAPVVVIDSLCAWFPSLCIDNDFEDDGDNDISTPNNPDPDFDLKFSLIEQVTDLLSGNIYTLVGGKHDVGIGQKINGNMMMAWDNTNNLMINKIIFSESPFHMKSATLPPFVTEGSKVFTQEDLNKLTVKPDTENLQMKSHQLLSYSIVVPSKICTPTDNKGCVDFGIYKIPVKVESTQGDVNVINNAKIEVRVGTPHIQLDIPTFVMLALIAMAIIGAIFVSKRFKKKNGSKNRVTIS